MLIKGKTWISKKVKSVAMETKKMQDVESIFKLLQNFVYAKSKKSKDSLCHKA